MANTGDPILDAYREKYLKKANPDQPTTVTGSMTGDPVLDEYLRKSSTPSINEVIPDNPPSALQNIPGLQTDRGTFVPEFGEMYATPSEDIATNVRRNTVRDAYSESLKTEEQLKSFGIETPPLGTEQPSKALKYITMPLEALKQLQRGQFAVVGGLEGIFAGDPASALKNFYRGLVFAEEHNTADLLDKYNIAADSPVAKFLLGLGGDVILDPLTYLSFGTSAIAKGAATSGIKTAEHLNPLLSKFGKQALKEAMETVPEDAAVNAVVQEIAKGTKLGNKLIPSGVRFSHWVPVLKEKRLGDLFDFTDLVPGGVIQKVNDLAASQSIMDGITGAIVKSPTYNWLGKAFVPYWDIRKKYPFLVDLDRAYQAKQHYRAQTIVDRGKVLVKMLPDEDERKLLTELLERPELLTGKKMATITKVDPAIPEVKINTDYWPEGQKLGEQDANELVDFFTDVAHRLRMDPRNEDMRVLNRAKLGSGAMGDVYGGSKWEPLRPHFETMVAANPDAKAYKIWFGDWVIKLPRITLVRYRRVPTAITDENLMAGNVMYDNLPFGPEQWSDLAGELYSSAKLSGSGLVPETNVVWRKAKELNPTLEGIYNPVHPGRDLANDPELAPYHWANVVGGWHEYLRRVPAEQRDITNIGQFAEQALAAGWKAEDFMVPIIVKRYVKGKTIVKFLSEVPNHPDPIASLAKAYVALEKTVRQIARAGVSVGDFHGGNVMLDETLNAAAWIDNARFYDVARGVVSGGSGGFGFEGRFAGKAYTTIEQIQANLAAKMPDYAGTVAPEIRTAGEEIVKTFKVNLARANDREVPVIPLSQMGAARPGGPLWEFFHPAIEAEQTNEAVVANLKNAFIVAYESGLDNANAGGAGAIGETLGEVNNYLRRKYNVADPREHAIFKREKLRFAQLIKDGGAIKSYQISEAGRMTVKPFPASELAFTPLSKTINPGAPRREWTEQAEVLVSKHQKLLTMDQASQDRILEAYGMAKEWKTELETMLVQRNLLEPERIAKFKEKFGLQHIPHMRDINSPISLFKALNAALKNKKNIGALKVRDIPGAIAEINHEFGKQFFEDDIATILTKHAVDVTAATDSFDHLSEIARLYGKPVDVVNKKAKNGRIVAHTVPDAGWKVIDHPALAGVQLPEEIAGYFSKYAKTFGGDSVSKHMWRNYDKILGMWKGYATFVNPGFHGRNFFSNLYQLYLKDGPDAVDLTLHKAAVDILRGKAGFLKLANGEKVPYSQVMDDARRYGVYGTGWFHADIKSVEDVKGLLAANKKPGSYLNPKTYTQFNNPLFNVGRFAGGTIENEARMVGFISDYRKTANPVFAATNTKKYLFDYNELTDFERDVMKRIFPFYTWMRKNTALQTEQIVKQPAKYANIERVKQNLERQAPDSDERWLPKYFPELYAIRTPLKSKEGSGLWLNPNLPFQDLNRAFDPNDWINSLAPWKAVFELALNKQLFNKKEIQKYSGELTPAPWMEIIPEHIASKVGPMFGMTKYYDKDSAQWLWGMNPKVKYALETVNPFFRNIGKFMATSTEQVPGYAKEKFPYDVMSWMTGVKMMPYNPTAEYEKSVFTRRDKLRDIKRRQETLGNVPTKFLPKTK